MLLSDMMAMNKFMLSMSLKKNKGGKKKTTAEKVRKSRSRAPVFPGEQQKSTHLKAAKDGRL